MDQQNDTCVRLVFDGPRTIATSDETLQSLRETARQGVSVEIDCTALTAVDLSFIQMLLAARRAILATESNLTIQAQASGPLEKALKAGGFFGMRDISNFITFSA